MKYCSVCGSKNPLEASICKNCTAGTFSFQPIMSSISDVPEAKERSNGREALAAQKIQTIYRLKRLWDRLTADPAYYQTFSNDAISQQMFGAHVASFIVSSDGRSARNYISNIKVEKKIGFLDKYHRITPNGSHETFERRTASFLYYRFDSDGVVDTFNMMPAEELNGLEIGKAGICRTKWQDAIVRFKSDESRLLNTKTKEGVEILKKFSKTPREILCSKEFIMLYIIGNNIEYEKFNFSLHAQELCDMLTFVCQQPVLKNLNLLEEPIKTRVQDNLSRIYLFLCMLVYLHNNNHVKFGALIEPLVHEISLLVFEIIALTQAPLITHQQFLRDIRKEFLGSANISGTFKVNHATYPNIHVLGYAANSGMHAYTLSLYITKIILGINAQTQGQHVFNDYRLHNEHPAYYETRDSASKILKIARIASPSEILKNGGNFQPPNIHIINVSVLGYKAHTEGWDINKYFNQHIDLFNNGKQHVIIMDTTCVYYNYLALEEPLQNLINRGLLTIIAWESWQKFGLLGTDQAQFGRVIVL
ncbi:MAG: hypothetical protein K0S63_1259, partial [Gammaproteobacteria bacterium]|nr:hypothetical protein [Gammaproteobacteria bacterium]